jgi:hypothetical protein
MLESFLLVCGISTVQENINNCNNYLHYLLRREHSVYTKCRGFAPAFVNYKKGCTRLAAANDKVYQLLAHGRWFSPAFSTTKTGRHDIAEILLKVALNTKNQIKSIILRIIQ